MRRIPKRLARLSVVLASIAALGSTGPAPAALGTATIDLTPATSTNNVTTQHVLTAHVEIGMLPWQGGSVVFSVSGAHTDTRQAMTDVNGNATYAYTGTNVGMDTISAFADCCPQNGMFDVGTEPSDTATKTWAHVKKDPRTDDWPKLTADELKSVQDLIDAGKNAEALAKLVEIMKKYCCNFDTMEGGAPVYDPKEKKAEGATQKKKGGRVRIGVPAFKSASWLYSSLKHEMVHSAQWQDEDAAKKMGVNGREKEAYQREIDQAGNTGISDKDKKELEKRIKAY